MFKLANQSKPARPAHEVRIGLIKAAIWANGPADGVFYNVTFERSYKDGDEWKSSISFGRDDLLKLAKVADEAHSWITRQGTAKSSKANSPRANSPKAG